MAVHIPPPTPEHLRFLAPFGPEITGIALAVRKLVLSEAKGAVELIYDAYNAVASGYSFTGRPSDACVHIAVYARWVNLGFHRGSQLPDPEKRLQGNGNWIRHIRIVSKDDLKDPAIRAFVKAAIERATYPDAKDKPEPVSEVRGNYPKKRRPSKP
jgi:hypothetical protein